MNEILMVIFHAVISPDGKILFEIMAEPVKTTVEICMEVAKQVNDDSSVKEIVMCLPQMSAGLPV